MRKRREEFPELIKEQKHRSYYAHHEENRAKNAERYQREREHRLAYAVEYRKANRESLRIWHREYQRANREKRNEKDRKSYAKHHEKRTAARKYYRNENRIAIRLRNRARRVSLKYSLRDFSPADWQRCLNHWGGRCAVCGTAEGDGLCIAADHWIPLSKGGTTDRTNIVPLCHGYSGCNNGKRDKMPLDWLYHKLGQDAGQKKAAEIEEYFASL